MCSTNQYAMAKVHMVIMGLILIGGLNWLSTAFGYNLVEMLNNTINQFFNSNIPIDKIIYVIGGLCAVHIMFKLDTWLPFLGKTILPDNLIPLSVPHNTDTIVKVKVKPNSKVIYWAALPRGKNPTVEEAYDDYSNSGVAISDSEGNVNLLILEGTSYKVPSGSIIKKHIHYRELDQEYGFLGEVKTVFY
jgi:uncharacterized membrane protein YuzA (DUF378 family)